jgi:hypothetical protein
VEHTSVQKLVQLRSLHQHSIDSSEVALPSRSVQHQFVHDVMVRTNLRGHETTAHVMCCRSVCSPRHGHELNGNAIAGKRRGRTSFRTVDTYPTMCYESHEVSRARAPVAPRRELQGESSVWGGIFSLGLLVLHMPSMREGHDGGLCSVSQPGTACMPPAVHPQLCSSSPLSLS